MGKGEPQSEKLVQDYVSTLYPKRYSGSGFLYHARIATQMLEGVKFKDGRQSDKILDVGCGRGFLSQLYPSFDITGLDISDGMLAKNPYKWIKGSAEDIPFDNETFDFVICRSLLHHLDDPRAGLREMVRVLKKGGKWVCWDPNKAFLATLFRKLFQKTDRFSHLHHSFDADELFRMIEGAGLEITDKRYIGFLGYPLLGFPDVCNFHIPVGIGRHIMSLDDLISKTPLKTMAWSLMVKGVKS